MAVDVFIHTPTPNLWIFGSIFLVTATGDKPKKQCPHGATPTTPWGFPGRCLQSTNCGNILSPGEFYRWEEHILPN